MMKLDIQLFADGKVVFDVDLETKSFEEEIEQTEDRLNRLLNAYEKASKTKGNFKPNEEALAKFRIEIEKTSNKLIDLRKRQDDLSYEYVEMSNNKLKDIGNSLTSIVKKVVKWGLAVFGIRTAYLGVRKIIGIVSRENENIAKQLQSISNVFTNALATVLTPVVQKIINLIAKLMMYINYIYSKLTGKNLFNFSKAFETANKNSSGIAKNMNKITAGFDEMNVLQDTSSGGISGGGTESFDNPFKDWENFKPPKWLDDIVNVLQWIKDNWKIIVAGILAIAGAILLIKLIQFIKGLKGASEALGGISADFTGFLDGLGVAVEAIAILGGLALVIKSVTDMIKAFAESGLEVSDVLSLFAGIVASIIVLVGTLTIASQLLQNPMAMGGLVLITAAIVALLFTIREVLPDILNALGDFIVKIGPTLNMILETMGKNLSMIIYALGTALPPILNSLGNLFDKIFKGIDRIINSVGNTIVNMMNTAKSLITTVLYTILDFINRLGPAVNNLVDNIIRAVTRLINFMISGIEYMINTLVIGSLKGFINKINKLIPGDSLDLNVPSNVSIPRFIPRLAKGGIINMPGRGVLVGNAIGGERGQEGVIPLTDSQQMALLGEAIGKYININATVPVYVGNRQIAREIRKINAEDDFAYNGG